MFQKLDLMCNIYSSALKKRGKKGWCFPSKQSQDIPQYPDMSHLHKDNTSRFTSSEATFMTSLSPEENKTPGQCSGEKDIILKGFQPPPPTPPELSAKYSKSCIL